MNHSNANNITGVQPKERLKREPNEITTQDLIDKLVFCNQALAEACCYAKQMSDNPITESRHICRCLSMSCLNSNDDHRIIKQAIEQTLMFRRGISEKYSEYQQNSAFQSVDDSYWQSYDMVGCVVEASYEEWSALKTYLLWAIKGLACYSRQAAHLGYEEVDHYQHIEECLSLLHREQDEDTLWSYIERTSKLGYRVLQLLDAAKTTQFGAPELTLISTTCGKRPGILVCGEDLKDLEQLLIQTENTGVDIYTHDALLTAHSYPEFQKFNHLIGNYGFSWYQQATDYKAFEGAVLLTTTPLLPPTPDNTLGERIFTTGVISNPQWQTLNTKLPNGAKDFTPIIEMAKHLKSPQEQHFMDQIIGFGHQQSISLLSRMVHALKHKLIEHIIFIHGYDAPDSAYSYYSDLIENLPHKSILFVSGSIKYRFNQKEYGNIAGLPRLMDAGQNSDIYSWFVFLSKLTTQIGYSSPIDLPVKIYSSVYEQKSLFTHVTLLSQGFKEIELGPSRPDFITEKMVLFLKEHYHCTVRTSKN